MAGEMGGWVLGTGERAGSVRGGRPDGKCAAGGMGASGVYREEGEVKFADVGQRLTALSSAGMGNTYEGVGNVHFHGGAVVIGIPSEEVLGKEREIGRPPSTVPLYPLMSRKT